MDGSSMGGGLTPQQLQAFLDYAVSQGSFNEQDRAIQQQLANAYALRNRQPPEHKTGAGGPLGAAASMINTYKSYQQEQQARQQDKALQDRQTAAMGAVVAALRSRQAAQQGTPAGIQDPLTQMLSQSGF